MPATGGTVRATCRRSRPSPAAGHEVLALLAVRQNTASRRRGSVQPRSPAMRSSSSRTSSASRSSSRTTRRGCGSTGPRSPTRRSSVTGRPAAARRLVAVDAERPATGVRPKTPSATDWIAHAYCGSRRRSRRDLHRPQAALVATSGRRHHLRLHPVESPRSRTSRTSSAARSAFAASATSTGASTHWRASTSLSTSTPGSARSSGSSNEVTGST